MCSVRTTRRSPTSCWARRGVRPPVFRSTRVLLCRAPLTLTTNPITATLPGCRSEIDQVVSSPDSSLCIRDLQRRRSLGRASLLPAGEHRWLGTLGRSNSPRLPGAPAPQAPVAGCFQSPTARFSSSAPAATIWCTSWARRRAPRPTPGRRWTRSCFRIGGDWQGNRCRFRRSSGGAERVVEDIKGGGTAQGCRAGARSRGQRGALTQPASLPVFHLFLSYTSPALHWTHVAHRHIPAAEGRTAAVAAGAGAVAESARARSAARSGERELCDGCAGASAPELSA